MLLRRGSAQLAGGGLRLRLRLRLGAPNRAFSPTSAVGASAPPGGPSALYDKLCTNGEITADPHQLAAMVHLQALHDQLISSGYAPPPLEEVVTGEETTEDLGVGGKIAEVAQSWGLAFGGGSENPSGAGGPRVSTFGAPKAALEENSGGGGLFGGLFGGGGGGGGGKDGQSAAANAGAPTFQRPAHAPNGVYMYGGVGTGKTFIMDLFFDAVPIEAKRRVHFNQFMLDVHARLHRLRGSREDGVEPIIVVVRELMEEGWLLCFDEFQVTDIADAMIMKRLFSLLLAHGAVLVATSNRPPRDLYLNGIQRDLFLPFIDMVEDTTVVHSLEESTTDYRLVKSYDAADGAYFLNGYDDAAKNAAAREQYETLFSEITKGGDVVKATLRTQGRTVNVGRAVLGCRTARFSFQELCGTASGAADFMIIAKSFYTIFLEDVPQLTLKDINVVRRLIVLIDTLYEYNVKVVVLAAAEPPLLFQANKTGAKGEEDAPTNHGDLLDDGKYVTNVHDEVFAFDRTVSRLMEMQSKAYLSAARPLVGTDFLQQEIKHLEMEEEPLSDDEIRAVWDAYDVDETGTLDRHEFHALMEDLQEIKAGHRNFPIEATDVIFEELDQDKNGTLEWDEFRAAGRRFHQLSSTYWHAPTSLAETGAFGF